MTYDLQNHTYIFNIYTYMIWWNVHFQQEWQCLILVTLSQPLVVSIVVLLVPFLGTTGPSSLSSHIAAQLQIWLLMEFMVWSEYSWLHDFIRQKKYVSDWSRKLCIRVSGSRWKVSSGLIPKPFWCDNLILRSPLMWKVWSWRWVAIHKHDPQAERVRAGRARFRNFVGESMGKLRCIYL